MKLTPGDLAIFDLVKAWRQESAKYDKVETIGGILAVLRERHGDNYARYAVLLFAAVEKLATRKDISDDAP